jgi:hypothetical protein
VGASSMRGLSVKGLLKELPDFSTRPNRYVGVLLARF